MPKKNKILIVFGTRPEAIKLAPVIMALKQSAVLDVKICVTSQHTTMLTSSLTVFNIQPDYKLDVMEHHQDLSQLCAKIMAGLHPVYDHYTPDLVMVHGDTTSAFAAAMSAFYRQIPVAHVEAGLRSYDKKAPYPEEINRTFIDKIADHLFAPTARAAQALVSEQLTSSKIIVTGNTIVDALLYIIKTAPIDLASILSLDMRKPFILVTGHRRESFGQGIIQVCKAIATIAAQNPKTSIVFPVHLNPKVSVPVHHHLGTIKNIILTKPLDYPEFIALLQTCSFVISDSGGIQEEACVLKKPLLLMREVTERPEAVEAGFVKLVGTDPESIILHAQKLLDDADYYQSMVQGSNPFGDGNASSAIVKYCEALFSKSTFNNPHPGWTTGKRGSATVSPIFRPQKRIIHLKSS